MFGKAADAPTGMLELRDSRRAALGIGRIFVSPALLSEFPAAKVEQVPAGRGQASSDGLVLVLGR